MSNLNRVRLSCCWVGLWQWISILSALCKDWVNDFPYPARWVITQGCSAEPLFLALTRNKLSSLSTRSSKRSDGQVREDEVWFYYDWHLSLGILLPTVEWLPIARLWPSTSCPRGRETPGCWSGCAQSGTLAALTKGRTLGRVWWRRLARSSTSQSRARE